MARRLRTPLALAALVAALAACGSGVTYGIAPGPEEAQPVVDSGPAPVRDSGPPTPPPDAGENCVQVELPPPDEAESLAEFTRLNVAAGFSCATCHRNRSPDGTGLTWGGPDNVEGWHAASAALAARAVEAGEAIEQSSLYRHFNGSDGTHPVNEAARDAAAVWLAYLWEPRYELVCEEPGPDAGGGGDPCYLPYADADSQAYFAANLESAFINCSVCHRSQPGATNGNLQYDASNAWQVAKDRIEAGAATAADTTIGKIMQADEATYPGHGYVYSAADAAETWIENHLHGVPTGAPGCE